MRVSMTIGAAALAALGWLGAPQAFAFTIEPLFAPPESAAPLDDQRDQPPLFDHRFDRRFGPGIDRRSDGTQFRLPGGGTFQFYGPSSGWRDDGESRFFGRMPDSVQPFSR